MTKVNMNSFFFDSAIKIYQPLSLKHIAKRLMFLLAARRHSSVINDFKIRLDRLGVPVTPEMLGTIVWPYIHNEWGVAAKFEAIATHYETLSLDYPKLSHIVALQRIKICDFSHMSSAVTIEMDYPKWFTREGELAINVFQGDLRVATMACTLANKEGETVVYIGAVQGIHGGVPAEESLEIYKILTKSFGGLRPRSLLLEVLKVAVRKLGAKKIFGVSEQNRHHRHKYFGNDQDTHFLNNYNVFWEEHGGVLNENIGFYEVPMKPAIREISEIASKKRGQYKRRYEFIESIDSVINLNGLA